MHTVWGYLRGRILLTNLLVLLISAGIILLLTLFVTLRLVDESIRPNLITLSQSLGDPALIYLVEQQTVRTFRNTVLLSVAISSGITLIVSILVSFWLWRSIVRPLQQLETSSQRIAAGQYRERIPAPSSGELATVVTAFNQMANSLDDTERRRITLINNVTHELRTPLTSLRGYLEALADGYFTLDGETIGEMEQELDRLTRLVSSIHTLSRIETDAHTLTLETFDLVPLVQRVFSQQQHIARHWSLDAPDTLLVVADRDATMQILVNLLGNAVRYSAENTPITLQLTTQGNDAILHVTDAGIGIDSGDLPHIFERFYRSAAARQQHGDGSGIGLTIAQQLAWSQSGTLTASSPGHAHGSTFTLTLPLA